MIHATYQMYLMKKLTSKLCDQDPEEVMQAKIYSWVYNVADKTTAIPKMLKKFEIG